jgi:HK97 gp10 family phage protein
MKVSVKFEGGKELAAALGRLGPRVSKRLVMEALMEAAEPVRHRMRSNAPYDPTPDGLHIRDEIVIGRSRGVDARETAVAVGPSRRAYYASFHEIGTAHQSPKPFARPAFDATYRQALQIFGAAVWRELAGRGIRRGSVDADIDAVEAPSGGVGL